MTAARKRAWLAAALSLLVPGAGQLATGDVAVGVFWLVIATLFWLSRGAELAWIVHGLASLSAYWAVQRKTARPGRRR